MSKTPKYLVIDCGTLETSPDNDGEAQAFDDITAAQTRAAELATCEPGVIFAIVAPIAFVTCAVGDPVVTPVEDNAE